MQQLEFERTCTVDFYADCGRRIDRFTRLVRLSVSPVGACNSKKQKKRRKPKVSGRQETQEIAAYLHGGHVYLQAANRAPAAQESTANQA